MFLAVEAQLNGIRAEGCEQQEFSCVLLVPEGKVEMSFAGVYTEKTF